MGVRLQVEEVSEESWSWNSKETEVEGGRVEREGGLEDSCRSRERGKHCSCASSRKSRREEGKEVGRNNGRRTERESTQTCARSSGHARYARSACTTRV